MPSVIKQEDVSMGDAADAAPAVAEAGDEEMEDYEEDEEEEEEEPYVQKVRLVRFKTQLFGPYSQGENIFTPLEDRDWSK